MTILELAAKLDDYSGTLGRMVEKLQIERARGALSQDEEMDLVQDLRKALEEHLIRPKQVRAGWALAAVLLLLAAWFFLPARIPNYNFVRLGLLLLTLPAFIFAGLNLWAARTRQKNEGQWLLRAEAAVKRGETVFDVR
jgi:hypothetical protein